MQNLFLYKMIILYMLDRAGDYPLTNTQISGFILDQGYTTIFNIHESLSELIASDFITVSTLRDTQQYTISDQGREVLTYGEKRLPARIRKEVGEYLKKEKINLKNAAEVFANYYPNDQKEFTVECCIREQKEDILNLKFNVPTKGMAVSICDAWPEKSSEIYTYLMNHLVGNKK